jgi:hypothetical protein
MPRNCSIGRAGDGLAPGGATLKLDVVDVDTDVDDVHTNTPTAGMSRS